MCEMSNKKRIIGIWMSEKKSQKLNWIDLTATCHRHGYKLVKLDLSRPLEEQGPIHVFLHKLTDIIAAADQGDSKAKGIITQVEQYISNHPEMLVIDPLNNVRILLDRYRYYKLLDDQTAFKSNGIFTPPFAKLTSNNHNNSLSLLREQGVTFPLVCKPSVAHGSKSAHEMALVFNEKGLRSCRPPCVVQSFVNHNALLYKVFLIGSRYFISERPSVKNLYACNQREPIYYNTCDVCKAKSNSTLSVLDPQDQPQAGIKMTLDERKVRRIIKVLQKEIGLLMFGFDIVIDNVTGNHAIIDINVFPGYDNYPNYFENLLDCVDESLDRFANTIQSNKSDASDIECNVNSDLSLINVGVSSIKMNLYDCNHTSE